MNTFVCPESCVLSHGHNSSIEYVASSHRSASCSDSCWEAGRIEGCYVVPFELCDCVAGGRASFLVDGVIKRAWVLAGWECALRGLVYGWCIVSQKRSPTVNCEA